MIAKVITMCHWRRPKYTRVCLEHLARCQGISDYTVIMHIDGKGDPGVLKECDKFRGKCAKLKLAPHLQHLGCSGNTFQALQDGFALSDYVIHIEDDVVFAKDALKFLEWASQFESDKRIFTTGAWRHHNGWLPPPDQNRPWIPGHERWASLFPGFFVWGWATWQSRWQEMKAGWTKGPDTTRCWDTVLTREVRGKRYSFLPLIGRANNIGEDLGTHRGAQWINHWAESPGFIYPDHFERIESVPDFRKV